MPKEQYMCQLCANHGHYNQPKKGHKGRCPNRACRCSLCSLNTKRRALDQIERKWKLKNEEIQGKEEEKEAAVTIEEEDSYWSLSSSGGSFASANILISRIVQVRNMMELGREGRRHAFHSIELLLAQEKH